MEIDMNQILDELVTFPFNAFISECVAGKAMHTAENTCQA
jgi:hypothetical protein